MAEFAKRRRATNGIYGGHIRTVGRTCTQLFVVFFFGLLFSCWDTRAT